MVQPLVAAIGQYFAAVAPAKHVADQAKDSVASAQKEAADLRVALAKLTEQTGQGSIVSATGSATTAPSPPPAAVFVRPVQGTRIRRGDFFPVEGKVEPLPEGADLWLVHRRSTGDLIGWPESRLTLDKDGKFNKQDRGIGAPGPFSVCVFAVSAEISRKWHANIRKEHELGDPAIDGLGCAEFELTP